MRQLGGWRILFAIVSIGFAAGCGSSLPGTDLPPTRNVAPALEFPGLRDYRGVVDCKMRESGFDEAKLGELARSAQIDFVFLGDYANPGQSDFGIAGFTEEVLFIPGASFKAANSGAEIVGLNLQHPIDAGQAPSDIIGQIHDQRAVALAVNPAKFASPDQYSLADAIEVFNLSSLWNEQAGMGLYLRAAFLSGDRLFRSLDLRPDANLASYDRMASGARVTLLAGVGAAPQRTVMGAKVGTFEQIFQAYTTHLLARERQTGPLVDALKLGHAYISFDLVHYVDHFAFFAQSGERKVMMGDEVSLAPGLKLRVEMPVAAEKLLIFADGVQAASAQNVASFEFAPAAPGAYRVEAYLGGHPWIYSNPVYVR